ncbi:uncharacterized protein LOC133778997 [Humulus lupulus]|uniref:uncharacterized protein LOC133778997 n=1 Tax=Humulus lupulus TaxID=3486 RepID=UPI002B402E77|nr:uncharacterized protein LOC133778997 [Humulus lupulus]
MAPYLAKAQEMLHNFQKFTILQVPREQNSNVDALAKLATTKDVELMSVVPINYLDSPSIMAPNEVETVQPQDGWMEPIIKYLVSEELPQDKKAARKLLIQVPMYIIMDNRLYKRGYLLPLLRCMSRKEASSVLREVHEDFCGNHAGGKSLSKKILRQGYFWPTMNGDAMDYVKRCENASVSPTSPEHLQMSLLK